MAKYYWTTTPEPTPVYHNNWSCEEGKKIEAKNRQEGDTPPAGRRLCEEC